MFPVPDPEERRAKCCYLFHRSFQMTEEQKEIRELHDGLTRCPLDVKHLAFCVTWTLELLYRFGQSGEIGEVELIDTVVDGLEHRVRPAENGDLDPGRREIRELVVAAVARARKLGWLVERKNHMGCEDVTGRGRKAALDYRLWVTKKSNTCLESGTLTIHEFVLSLGFRRGQEARRARWRFAKYLRRNKLMPVPEEPGQVTQAGKPGKAARFDAQQLVRLWRDYQASGHMANPQPRKRRKPRWAPTDSPVSPPLAKP